MEPSARGDPQSPLRWTCKSTPHLAKELQTKGEVMVDGRTVRLEDVSLPRPGQSIAFLPPCRPSAAALELCQGAAILVVHGVRRAADVRASERMEHLTTVELARIAIAAGKRGARAMGIEVGSIASALVSQGDGVALAETLTIPVLGGVASFSDLSLAGLLGPGARWKQRSRSTAFRSRRSARRSRSFHSRA
ncbi:MAG: hypothetical protein HC882_09350 [Acidobacteria bacterium]|nr:hypothetical protein [Acidobacteriota bacterium]